MSIFEKDGFHMHEVKFEETYYSIRYTHQGDSSPEVGVTQEVHIPFNITDEDIRYWSGELMQAVEELVAHTQRHLRDQKANLRLT
jgi:hypothetical protein